MRVGLKETDSAKYGGQYLVWLVVCEAKQPNDNENQ